MSQSSLPEKANRSVITDWRLKILNSGNSAAIVWQAAIYGSPFPVCYWRSALDVVQRGCR